MTPVERDTSNAIAYSLAPLTRMQLNLRCTGEGLLQRGRTEDAIDRLATLYPPRT